MNETGIALGVCAN